MGYWIPRCRASAASGSTAAAALGFEHFDDDEMTAGMNQLELNIISAQDVKKEERWMQTAISGMKSGGSNGAGGVQMMYALACLQSKKMRTHSVACSDQNPAWNARLHFLVHDEFLKDESSAALTVEIYAQFGRRTPSATGPRRRDTLLGTARVLLSTLAKKGRGYQGARTLALQLRRPSGRPHGILNIGCIVHAYDARISLPAPSRLNLLDAEAAAAAAAPSPATTPKLSHSTTPRFSAFKEIQEKCRKSFSVTSTARASSADADSGFRHQLVPARASSAAASFAGTGGLLNGLIPPPLPPPSSSSARRFSLDARHSFAYELRHGLVVNTPSTSSSAASCTASSASSSAITDVDDYICYYEDEELAVSQFPEHSGLTDDENYAAGGADVATDYEEDEFDAGADEEEELAMEAIYRKLKSCIKINDEPTAAVAPTVVANSSSSSSSSSFSIEASTICSSSTATTTISSTDEVELINEDAKSYNSSVSEQISPKITMKTMEEFADQIRDMETFTKAIEDQRATSVMRMKAVAQKYKVVEDEDCIGSMSKIPAKISSSGGSHNHGFITMELQQDHPLAAPKPPRHRAPWAKKTNWNMWSKAHSKIHLSPSDQKLN